MHPFANRGMFLESLINYTIISYRNNKIALFYKRPVEIIPLDKYQSQIEHAYFKGQAGCDYYGIYQGSYFEFEAKETRQKKFNLSSLKPRQIHQLQEVTYHKGHSFIIVYFHIFDRFFVLSYHIIKKWLETTSTKQIPLAYFLTHGIELTICHPHFLDLEKVFSQLISYT